MAKRDANEMERGKSKLSEQMEKLRAAQEQVNMLRRLVSKSPGSLERRQATAAAAAERESTPVRSGGASRPSSSRVAVQSPMRFAGAPVNAPINVAPINVAPINIAPPLNVHPVKPVMTLDDLPFAIRYSQLLDDDAVIGLFFRNFFNNFQYTRQPEISFESPFEMLSKMEAVCQNNRLRSLLGRLSNVRDESELDVLCNVALCAVEEASASEIEAPPNEEESLFSEADPLNETDPNLEGSQDDAEDQEPSGTESDNSVIVQDDEFESGSEAEHGEENSVESVLYHPETPEDDRTDELPAEVSNEFVQSFAERYEAELIDNEFLIKNLDLAIVSQMDKHGPNAEFTPEITDEIIQEMQQFDEAKLGNLRGALTSLLVPFHHSSMVKTKDQILKIFSECLYDALVQSRIAQNASFDAEEGDGGDPDAAQDKQ